MKLWTHGRRECESELQVPLFRQRAKWTPDRSKTNISDFVYFSVHVIKLHWKPLSLVLYWDSNRMKVSVPSDLIYPKFTGLSFTMRVLERLWKDYNSRWIRNHCGQAHYQMPYNQTNPSRQHMPNAGPFPPGLCAGKNLRARISWVESGVDW